MLSGRSGQWSIQMSRTIASTRRWCRLPKTSGFGAAERYSHLSTHKLQILQAFKRCKGTELHPSTYLNRQCGVSGESLLSYVEECDSEALHCLAFQRNKRGAPLLNGECHIRSISISSSARTTSACSARQQQGSFASCTNRRYKV